jgi:GntR family transcriptional regulator, transcriptional repressor for pyruvate dehydrogenase complex
MSRPTGEVLRASDAILGRILDGTYSAGLRLPAESELARELEVSRSTLREALRHLAGLGLLQSRRGSGVLVLDFRREGSPALLPAYLAAGRFDQPLPIVLGELLRVRAFLAAEAVRLAATYATEGSLGPARELLSQLSAKKRDPKAYARTELEMYRALAHASGVWPSVWLANAFFEPIREIMDEFAPVVALVPEGYEAVLEKVFRKIERGDGEGACAIVRSHFEELDRTVIRRLSKVLGSGARVEER